MPTDTDAPTLPDALGDAARAFIAGPHRLLIGAERPEAADGRTFATLDPATGREIAQVAHAGPADVAGAVAAEIESLDNGKPVNLARYVDVAGTVAHLRYFAGWPTKIEGAVLPVTAPNMHCYTRREPVGVCAQIVPWNFPLMMAAWKIAPALA